MLGEHGPAAERAAICLVLTSVLTASPSWNISPVRMGTIQLPQCLGGGGRGVRGREQGLKKRGGRAVSGVSLEGRGVRASGGPDHRRSSRAWDDDRPGPPSCPQAQHCTGGPDGSQEWRGMVGRFD